MLPADPFGDHSRRHRRPFLQQLPDRWLDLVEQRTRGDRWYFGGQSLGIACRTVFFKQSRDVRPEGLQVAVHGVGLAADPPRPMGGNVG